MWFPFLTETDDLPAEVRALGDAGFRAASYRVRDELKAARFEVGQDGKPTDTDVLAAIKDATAAQLSFFAETGDVTGAGAQSGGGSILSVTMPGGSGTTDLRGKQDARTAPAVAEILRSCPGITWAVGY